MNTVPDWAVTGEWFDVCSCAVGCPCEFAQPPTYGRCEAILAWHIDQGHYGQVRLDGLNVLGVSFFEGDLWAGQAENLTFGMFIDEGADEQQRQGLQAIFSGEAGGTPAELFAIWGPAEVVGLEFAPIRVTIAEDLSSWRAEVPDAVEASAVALTGPTTPPGARVQTFNPPGSETGGSPATWGVAGRHHVDALGLRWDWDGRSSKHIPFDWSGPS